MAGKNSDDIRCSFCNKRQEQVKKLIAGPAGVYICDECVEICSDIIEEEYEEEPVEEEFDINLNGSIQAAQQRIDELAHNIDELIKLASVPESAAAAMTDIKKFSEEMKALREFIEAEKLKQANAEHSTVEFDMMLKRLENENFAITEYDDVVVRQLIEKITVMDKNTITVTFKGGFEVRRELDNGN